MLGSWVGSELEARREQLDLPVIDREMLAGLLDDFEKVMVEGTNHQRKDLLHRLVKKVLVHDRRTLEVWYALPNRAVIEYSNKWLLGLIPQSVQLLDLAVLPLRQFNTLRVLAESPG